MWLTWIFTNWRLILAGLASALILTLYSWGSVMKAQRDTARVERDEKTAVIDSMRREATAYNDKSKQIAKETGDAFTVLVEQIKDKETAIRNAKSRFPVCSSANGVRADWLHTMPDSAGKANLPEGAGGVQEPERLAVGREFVESCATDAAFVRAVQDWRVANDLPVQ